MFTMEDRTVEYNFVISITSKKNIDQNESAIQGNPTRPARSTGSAMAPLALLDTSCEAGSPGTSTME